ncbi:2-amino-4-hydroxy-6-hydroxymethyldihydropteridinediphosphokinase [soil metagenome]
MTVRAYIGAGSNIGDRLAWLQYGVDLLAAHDEIDVLAVSPVYESEAHTLDGRPQRAYLNAVYEIATSLPILELLSHLMEAQTAAGRFAARSAQRWEPRTLDLDLLAFGQEEFESPDLLVPHPRLAERRFVLQPLADLAPQLIIPGASRSVADLLKDCQDHKACERIPDILRR